MWTQKFPEIWDQIVDSFNQGVTRDEIKREPDIWDDLKHYILNGGLEDYYNKHPGHVVPEDATSQMAA